MLLQPKMCPITKTLLECYYINALNYKHSPCFELLCETTDRVGEIMHRMFKAGSTWITSICHNKLTISDYQQRSIVWLDSEEISSISLIFLSEMSLANVL